MTNENINNTNETNTNVDEELIQFQGSKETLDQLMPILIAFSQSDVRGFTLVVPNAIASGMRIWKSFQADRADIVTSFTEKGFNADEVSNLAERISVFWQSDLNLQQALDPESAITEVIAEANVVHSKMAKGAKYVFEENDKIWKIVKDIRKGSGHMDRASDLARYAELFSKYWSLAEGRCNITEADIDRAKVLSTQILNAYTAVDGAKLARLKDIRARAAEYLCRAVDDIRDAAAYHYRKTPEAMDRYPSLYHYRKPPTRTDETEPTEAVEDDITEGLSNPSAGETTA